MEVLLLRRGIEGSSISTEVFLRRMITCVDVVGDQGGGRRSRRWSELRIRDSQLVYQQASRLTDGLGLVRSTCRWASTARGLVVLHTVRTVDRQ